ncbi:ArsC family reductase [Psychromonas sp. RZ22]|uniref:ArsC family reductase n=1 Tax=Psychromonas algarum TaxID=2555643 RepID=UPI001068A88C|nr:ArsC family reductase [Psychromonas sp. RZ22]TEW56039.1 ArsC family reductase [Psychromonas sp. RZ22]
MQTIMYGIPNCDTIKKAKKWLDDNNIPFLFHDYRKDGLDSNLISQLYQTLSWDELLNKRSTSYRALTDQQKESLNEKSASLLFIEFPTLIKRPLVIHQGVAIIGFNQKNYQTFFAV